MVFKFHMQHEYTEGFRIIKFGLIENPRSLPMIKIAKPIKSTFSPEWLGIFGWNFIWSISGTLVFRNSK